MTLKTSVSSGSAGFDTVLVNYTLTNTTSTFTVTIPESTKFYYYSNSSWSYTSTSSNIYVYGMKFDGGYFSETVNRSATFTISNLSTITDIDTVAASNVSAIIGSSTVYLTGNIYVYDSNDLLVASGSLYSSYATDSDSVAMMQARGSHGCAIMQASCSAGSSPYTISISGNTMSIGISTTASINGNINVALDITDYWDTDGHLGLTNSGLFTSGTYCILKNVSATFTANISGFTFGHIAGYA